jgi:hypothetical protein
MTFFHTFLFSSLSLSFVSSYFMNMSDFGDFSSSNDPTADFLARERAVLGGDADIFTTLDNNTAIPSYTSPTISVSGTGDLLDGGNSSNYTTTSNITSPQYSNSLVTTQQQSDYSVFESSYPKAENLESSHVKFVFS